MKKAPLARVEEKFGGKDKLVAALMDLVPRGEEEKETFRLRLLGASNSKLLRLHRVAEEADKHGGKSKIIEEVADLHKRGKDGDYKKSLGKSTTAHLLDLHRNATRAAGGASPSGKSRRVATKVAKKKGG